MTQKTLSVVTVDTASIQPYIYSSNKLKENIGASHIIENVLYVCLMNEVLQKVTGSETDYFGQWKSFLNEHQDATGQSGAPDQQLLHPGVPNWRDHLAAQKAQVGYIGGGNAMLMFDSQDLANEFIAEFSKAVLLHFPGINLLFGKKHDVTPDDLTEAKAFQELRWELTQSMNECRNQYPTQSTVFKPGIVMDCSSSGEAAEGENKEGSPISKVTQAKLDYAKEAFFTIQEKYENELIKGGYGSNNQNYMITNEVEQLGQEKDKGYIAVVHADANGMGQSFLEAENLAQLRRLSRQAHDIAHSVMRNLIEHIVGCFENLTFQKELPFKLNTYTLKENQINSSHPDFERLKSFEGRKILPIRPLLVAGDDITFVCEGRWGPYLAAKVLEYFEEEKFGLEEKFESEKDRPNLKACSGAAICKTHYPFFKAYTLSEALMEAAKKRDKASPDGEKHSWLHFLATPSGFNGDLDEVIESQFSVDGVPLINGPYCFTPDGPKQGETFDNLTTALKHYFEKGSAWPRNKIMEMREAITDTEGGQKLFIEEMKARGLKFHNTELKSFWTETSAGKDDDQEKEKNSPKVASIIYDAIEISPFFPESLFQIAPNSKSKSHA